MEEINKEKIMNAEDLVRVYVRREDLDFLYSEMLGYHFMMKFGVFPRRQSEVVALLIIEYKKSVLKLDVE